MLPTIALPGIDLAVSTIGLGAAGFGTAITGKPLRALVEQYLATGGNLFDTAHVYAVWVEGGVGASERALGEVVRELGIRAQVVIASKGGHPAIGEKYPRPDAFLAPEVIRRDIADSLDRLGMSAMDLYYLHRDDSRVPVGEILDVLNAEIAAGRLRALGASNWSTGRIAEANAWAEARGLRGFAISQPLFNLAVPNTKPTTDPTMRFLTDDDLRWHTESQLPVAAYSATATGFFADPARGRQFHNEHSTARRQRAAQLAVELGCAPGQVALAYVLCQPFPTVALTGTTNADHLADNLRAADIRLTPEQVRWLREG